jgi:hydrogenase maturation protease
VVRIDDANAAAPAVICIGIGDSCRHDDGVGPEVIRYLQSRGVRGATLKTHAGDGTQLLDLWKTYTCAILVDAVVSSEPPGAIHRINIHTDPLPFEFYAGSTHAVGLVEAFALGRLFNNVPARCLVWGVVGRDFSFGYGLSTEVREAVIIVGEQIAAAMAGLLDPLRSG